jgi:hypothetical protein
VAARGRGAETVTDMGRSLGIVFAVVVIGLLIGGARELVFPSRSTDRAVKTVGYSDEVGGLRHIAPYPVLAPEGLGPGWRATSARLRYDGGSVGLHIGFVTPRKAYAEVEESGQDPAAFQDSVLGGGTTALPAVSSGGRSWRQLRTSRGELALLTASGPATVVVTGSAGLPELSDLAGSLRTG